MIPQTSEERRTTNVETQYFASLRWSSVLGRLTLGCLGRLRHLGCPKAYLQHPVLEHRALGRPLGQRQRQDHVALEVADRDEQLVATLGHGDFADLDMRQWQAHEVFLALLDDLLGRAAVEHLGRA